MSNSDINNAAVQIAEEFSDETAKNQLLGEIVKLSAQSGQNSGALQTLQKIPNDSERKILLLGWDWKNFTQDAVRDLVTVIESRPQTATLAGRIALSMLEAEKTDTALLLLKSVKRPFETEKQRYVFLDNYLNGYLTGADSIKETLTLLDGFKDETYRSWGRLALAKRLAVLRRYQEAEGFAEKFTPPEQRSWVFLEFYKIEPANRHYLERAGTILNDLPLTFDTPESAESAAIQLRITGTQCHWQGLTELGEMLLEKSEAVGKSVLTPLPRLRLQCFLAKVLRELKLIDSAEDYIPLSEIRQEALSSIDRSKALVWFNEAAGLEQEIDWLRIIRSLNVREKGTMDTSRTVRITEILKRFAALRQQYCSAALRQQRSSTALRQPCLPSGNPDEDAVNLSGEEYESYYFSPFVSNDCGC
ncbi:MAG: hypothetical protein LBT46_07585 [Planctomycetaceae bacterium]|jgi:hypothetical protein|nr:hypothetical protein [Planctomycetaceae bacterium]